MQRAKQLLQREWVEGGARPQEVAVYPQTGRQGNAGALWGLDPRLWVTTDMNIFLRVPL